MRCSTWAGNTGATCEILNMMISKSRGPESPHEIIKQKNLNIRCYVKPIVQIVENKIEHAFAVSIATENKETFLYVFVGFNRMSERNDFIR